MSQHRLGPLEPDNCRLPFETRVILKLGETTCLTCGSDGWCVNRHGEVTAQGPSGFHKERREEFERIQRSLPRHREKDYRPDFPVRCGACSQQTTGSPCTWCGYCPTCGEREERA